MVLDNTERTSNFRSILLVNLLFSLLTLDYFSFKNILKKKFTKI